MKHHETQGLHLLYNLINFAMDALDAMDAMEKRKTPAVTLPLRG